MDADRFQETILNGAKQTGDAVDEGLAANEADVGMLLRLPQQVLARAEADLEPHLPHRNREERAEVLRRAYAAAESIRFEGVRFRGDIAVEAASGATVG